MADVIGVIKRAALEAVEDAAPAAVMFGAVERLSPMEIRVEQRLLIGAERIIAVGTAAEGLRIGDEVALLRQAGGQRFLLLGRIGSV